MAPAVSTLASPTSSGAEQPLAATLPPELLMLIFDAVQDQTWGSDAQRERVRQSLVCRSWFHAHVQRNDYVVSGERRPAALLRTFEANPAKAAQAQKIDFSSVKDCVVPLLRICPNAVEVGLHHGLDLSREVLQSLPAGLRKLKLSICAEDDSNWVPELTFAPTHAMIDLSIAWFTFSSAHTRRVLVAIEPALPRITALWLRHFASQEPSTERGYLERLIPKMTSIKDLQFSLWQVHTARIPDLVAQLDTLEELRIVDFDEDTDHDDGVTPAIATELIKVAPTSLKSLTIGVVVMTWDASPNGWSAQKMNEVETLANDRGIELEYFESCDTEDEESEDEEWVTTSDDSDEDDE